MPNETLYKILVFCDSSEEYNEVQKLLKNRDPDSLRLGKNLIIGMANDEDMSILHKKGIQVESAEPPLTGLGPVLDAKTAEDDLPAHQSKRSDPDLKRRFAKLELHTPPPIPEQKSDWYRLSFHGILTRYRRERLSELAIDLSAGYRKGFYQVFLTPKQLDELKKESFVKELRRYDLRDTVSSSLLATLEEADEQAEVQAISEASLTTLSSVHAAAPALYAFDIIAHRASDLPVILEVLKKEEASGTPIEIVGESPAAIRIRAPLSDDLLVRIALLTEVRMITPYKPPRLTSDQARKIIGVTRINPTASNQSFGKWTGRGERIAVLDSGICQSHPDFQGRLFLIQGFDGCSGDDEVGHGTHVAGIIAGNGQASNGVVCGIAPEAKLIVIGIVKSTERSFELNLPVDLSNLLHIPVLDPCSAKILNLSWARPIGSSYDAIAYAVDNFVYQHPDVLIIIAAGNEGQSPDGQQAFWKIGSPATAKNALTVGACGNDRPFEKTWEQYDDDRFSGPSGKFRMADSANTAALSSSGPTDYEGVKPDIVAPGTYILAARANIISGFIPYEPCSEYCGKYIYMHGTSMATGVVSGAAAVLRQYLLEKHNAKNPSAALMKAILINSTQIMKSVPRPNLKSAIGYPDFDQGFGRLDLSLTLTHSQAPANRTLISDDIPNNDSMALEAGLRQQDQGYSFHRYAIEVTPNATDPLRITLVWTDPPGDGTTNDLQVTVRLPNGKDLRGNEGHLYRSSSLPGWPGNVGVQDLHNTVKHIRIEKPKQGIYKVRVWAQNTALPKQGYALAVCGELKSKKLIKITY